MNTIDHIDQTDHIDQPHKNIIFQAHTEHSPGQITYQVTK